MAKIQFTAVTMNMDQAVGNQITVEDHQTVDPHACDLRGKLLPVIPHDLTSPRVTDKLRQFKADGLSEILLVAVRDTNRRVQSIHFAKVDQREALGMANPGVV